MPKFTQVGQHLVRLDEIESVGIVPSDFVCSNQEKNLVAFEIKTKSGFTYRSSGTVAKNFAKSPSRYLKHLHTSAIEIGD